MLLIEGNFRNKRKIYWFFQIGGWSLYYLSSGVIYALNHGVSGELTVNVAANILLMIAVTHGFRAVAIHAKWLNFSVIKLLSIFCAMSVLASVRLAYLNFYLDQWSFTPTDS